MRKEAQAPTKCDSASEKQVIETIIIQRLLLGVDAGLFNKLSTRPKESADDPNQLMRDNVSKVIDTPELLEAILFHLPVLDLVIATGVNKAVRTLIFSSPTLRRKLFLLPQKVESKKMLFKLWNQDGKMWLSDKQVEASLCPLLRMHYPWKRIAERYCRHGGESADIEGKAVGAHAWTDMHLSNPPCLTVDVHLSYDGQDPHDLIQSRVAFGRNHSLNVYRTIHHPNGVTFSQGQGKE